MLDRLFCHIFLLSSWDWCFPLLFQKFSFVWNVPCWSDRLFIARDFNLYYLGNNWGDRQLIDFGPYKFIDRFHIIHINTFNDPFLSCWQAIVIENDAELWYTIYHIDDIFNVDHDVRHHTKFVIYMYGKHLINKLLLNS